MFGNSPLGIRVRVGYVRDCEAETSRIVLMVGSHVHVIACVCVWNFGTKFF